MSPEPDTTSTTADNGGNFDPQQAAALLDQTTLQTRRRLEPAQPWLLVIRGILALAVCGAVWLSVRGQHPYQHPTAAVIPFVIAFGALNLVVTLAVARRATAGVSGRSRLRGAEIAVLTVIWAGVFVIMAVLAAAGVSNAIVYGLYPITVPLIAAGLAWAGIMATRADWRACGTGLAVAVVGAVGAFAGPAEAWAVAVSYSGQTEARRPGQANVRDGLHASCSRAPAGPAFSIRVVEGLLVVSVMVVVRVAGRSGGAGVSRGQPARWTPVPAIAGHSGTSWRLSLEPGWRRPGLGWGGAGNLRSRRGKGAGRGCRGRGPGGAGLRESAGD